MPGLDSRNKTDEKRPIAYHVGRHGDIAGGMTQVVNGFLGWDFPRFTVQAVMSRDGSHGLRALWLFISSFWRLATLSAPRRSVVIVHLSYGGSFVREGILLLLARARGIGTVAHLHGSRFVAFAERRGWLVGRVLGAATKIIVLSEAMERAVGRFVPASRIHLIQNAVPDAGPGEKENLVVFGGSVTYRKGVDVLASAWRRVGPGSGWRLEIAGPVIDMEVVPTELPDAKFLGSLPHDALLELLDRSTIAVLPSRDEAMPMFILEAMARDNCVISTRVGGIPAVLGDGCGILVDAGDEAQLAEALRRAMTDAEERERIARAGRRRFDTTFSASTVYPLVEDLWHHVLEHPTPAA